MLIDWTSCGVLDLHVAAVALDGQDERLGFRGDALCRSPRGDRLAEQDQIEQQFLARIRRACRQATSEERPPPSPPAPPQCVFRSRPPAPARFDQLCFVFDRGFAKDPLLRFLAARAFASSCGPTRTCVASARKGVRCSWSATSAASRVARSSDILYTNIRQAATGRQDESGGTPTARRQHVDRGTCGRISMRPRRSGQPTAKSSIEESFDAKTHWQIEQRRIQYADQQASIAAAGPTGAAAGRVVPG